MRVFATKPFMRFAHVEDITDASLCEAAARLAAGRIDAELGGGVIKQRIARRDQGRSGGFRTIILFRQSGHVFFAYGFAKNDRDNIRPDELRAFRRLAGEMLAYGDPALAAAIRNGTLTEIRCDGETVSQ